MRQHREVNPRRPRLRKESRDSYVPGGGARDLEQQRAASGSRRNKSGGGGNGEGGIDQAELPRRRKRIDIGKDSDDESVG